MQPSNASRVPRTVLALFIALLGHQAAIAQQTDAAQTLPGIQVTGRVDKGYDAKSTTTATKTDTPLLDTLQSITVITQQQIRDTGAQGLAEAARYVPGVGFAQGEGNRETPIFRGISTTGDFFIDGVRDDVQYYRDLYNIDRVEVFKGPNAMIFGRGATGGLINRVSKQADWNRSYGISLTGGSYQNRRATVDINQPINKMLAFRVNGLYENSESYRDGVTLKRHGINPTVSWKAGDRTLVTVGYERFNDYRVADRGIPSFQGRPVDTDRSTFFGNAGGSPTWSNLNAVSAMVDHDFGGGLRLKNRTRWSDQDKFYRNVFPGAVNAAGNLVAISAYDNATTRRSLFNQTDLTYTFDVAGIRQTLLAGIELGKQDTTNFRSTGYFAGNATSVNVPVNDPTSPVPLVYRQSATDADNNGTAKVAAIYLQDQIAFNRWLQLIVGVRYDRFKVDFTNRRTADQIDTSDGLTSPRAGVIVKPMENMSLYANYSIAYQPRAGDQLASLSLTTASLRPEKFRNYEVGAKWDVLQDLALTAAVYRLDRTNVVVLDPSDPTNTRTILSDGQRTDGFELGATGAITSNWRVAGGYSYADAKFTADTSATLRDGARVGQVPRHTVALWNRYDVTPMIGFGLGIIHRSSMFASNQLIATTATPIPNVELAGYTRFDGAVFFTLNRNLQMQLNVENLFDRKYYLNANSNSNITPGSPRAFRLTLSAAM